MAAKESGEKVPPKRATYDIRKHADEIFALLNNGELSDVDASEDENMGEENEETAFLVQRETTAAGVETGDSDSDWEIDFELNIEGNAPNFTEKEIKWKKGVEFEANNAQYDGLLGAFDDAIEPLFPVEYFMKYIPDELIEQMAHFTNVYALQKDSPLNPPTTPKEMKQFIGIHVYMSNIGFPRTKMFWEPSAKQTLVSETMSKNRFYKLRMNLHLVDVLADQNKVSTDRLYKVRPIYESVLSRCRNLTLEENVCVDEQMVPFKGQLNVKQYVKGKPHPWGVKIFVLCGKSGIAYDFLIYQGSTTELDQENLKKFGQGAAVVLQLMKRLPVGAHHKIYFDNYFTSYNLLEACSMKGVLAAGTVRVNRFANPPLKSDKDMQKNGRGSTDFVVSADGKIVLLKWQDNRSVVLGSNFVGKGTEENVKRWDKTNKKYIMVKCPEIVRLYNKSMGGVDKFDFLIGLYRIYIRSVKWTLRMTFHAVDFALVNSWLEYKRDCEVINFPKKNILDLMAFRFRVAEALIRAEQPTPVRRRGRPSQEQEPSTPPLPKKATYEKRPIPDIQFDRVDHMPEHASEKGTGIGRCKLLGCKGRSHVRCEKCQVYLCFSKDRNCYKAFHKKN